MYQIYLITNLINNKKYVGQTKKSKGYIRRFNSHIKSSYSNRQDRKLTYLHQSIKYYGEENFKVELIEDNIPEEEIDAREIFWIDYYKTYYIYNKGYNMTLGGQGTHGYKFNDNDKKKISNSSKQFWEDLKKDEVKYNEFVNMRRERQLGMKFSDEHRKKLSDLAKKRVGDKNSFYGKHHTEEAKNKIKQGKTKKVGMFDLDGNLIREFESLTDAAKFIISIGKCKSMCCLGRISKICNGIDKTAYGYIWKFL